MPGEYLVIEDYSSQYKEPIRLKKGERVKTGDRFREDPEWPGWIWCITNSGSAGWVLERVLDIGYDTGVVMEDYDATELNASKGEIVVGERIEGGWIWCRSSEGNYGWLPERNLKINTGD